MRLNDSRAHIYIYITTVNPNCDPDICLQFRCVHVCMEEAKNRKIIQSLWGQNVVAGRQRGRWRGGNSPAHLLSFSARFYPAEFLWQPLKKRCAVNCGFEMRCLIALCGGDGWLFRQPSPVRGNWWRAPMKQHSICFLWCVCQSLVPQRVHTRGCVLVCVCVCVCARALKTALH